jgi:DNA modification methylase
MRRPIINNSAAGDAIYEPFCGSGTTIIAAETTGRICHAMDIDARYIDVAVQRWQRMTGKAAVLVGEERTFNDIATARHSQNLLRAG